MRDGSIKGFSKRAYHFGVVVVTCLGARKHVVADNWGGSARKATRGIYPGEGEEEGREEEEEKRR